MIRKVGIVGFGTMGSGIAQVCLESQYEVVVFEKEEKYFERGLSIIQKNWNRSISKGKMTEEEKAGCENRLYPTTDMNRLAEVDYVIEAVTENLELKKQIFKALDEIVDKNTVLASNTSGLSITEMASVVSNPSRVMGCHFFNPVPVMKLVELIRSYDTSEETYETSKQLMESLGKETIDVKESPLFAVNRILVPMINEAILVLQEGIASAEDIDKGMKLGANHPIGPLALADLIGLDTLLFVQDSLYEETQDSKYRAALLLRKLVRAGHLGRKTGKGFYEYR
ncbi:MAG: 3-hydroxybutyryl-CoA dehydrogenase [Bacillaceae bacterium]|nr:3-hydroxybutyryl-CoA dehydrogenase [Bacillaceae bacterium]